jgi:hypothetical protein
LKRQTRAPAHPPPTKRAAGASLRSLSVPRRAAFVTVVRRGVQSRPCKRGGAKTTRRSRSESRAARPTGADSIFPSPVSNGGGGRVFEAGGGLSSEVVEPTNANLHPPAPLGSSPRRAPAPTRTGNRSGRSEPTTGRTWMCSCRPETMFCSPEAKSGRPEEKSGRHETKFGRHETMFGRHEVMFCRHEVMFCRHETMFCRPEVMFCRHETMFCRPIIVSSRVIPDLSAPKPSIPALDRTATPARTRHDRPNFDADRRRIAEVARSKFIYPQNQGDQEHGRNGCDRAGGFLLKSDGSGILTSRQTRGSWSTRSAVIGVMDTQDRNRKPDRGSCLHGKPHSFSMMENNRAIRARVVH